jgi:hypothetical protein
MVPLSITDVPDNRKCGATTRDGTPCQRWTAPGRSRCRLHGGATPRGDVSPHFKHGWYSKHPLYRLHRQAVETMYRNRVSIRKHLEAHGFVQQEDGSWNANEDT